MANSISRQGHADLNESAFIDQLSSNLAVSEERSSYTFVLLLTGCELKASRHVIHAVRFRHFVVQTETFVANVVRITAAAAAAVATADHREDTSHQPNQKDSVQFHGSTLLGFSAKLPSLVGSARGLRHSLSAKTRRKEGPTANKMRWHPVLTARTQ
jgi:hypothetical protein